MEGKVIFIKWNKKGKNDNKDGIWNEKKRRGRERERGMMTELTDGRFFFKKIRN